MLQKSVNKLLEDSYFTLLRKEGYFIELKSNATGHYWGVLSNPFDTYDGITLYHKKGSRKNRYETYSKCDSVILAINLIKEYETQLLEIQKSKQKVDGSSMIRKLKVYESSGYKYKPIPSIILKGEWLKNCGFDIGQELEVEYSGEGKLIIRKVA